MYAGASLRIDAAAIADNTRRIAGLTRAGGSAPQLMAVVKADGFGHGAAALAALDAGASWLGVTSIAEALPFRWRGISVPILSWLNAPGADLDAALLHDIDLAIPSIRQLQAVSAAAVRTGRRARIHLHIDTGMARDGIDRSEWTTLCELARLGEAAGRLQVVGVMSHLARADEPGHAETRKQVLLFRNALRAARHRGLTPGLAHLAATAGALTDETTRFGMVRIGAGLYGIDPSHTHTLRGAMTLTAPVIAVRDVDGGTGVGYGLRYRTSRRTRLALLPLGYADGIPRNISPDASVLLRGRRVPIAGTVSMDQLVLDVGDAGVQVGELATVFGPGEGGPGEGGPGDAAPGKPPGDAAEPTMREWADWAGTIEHDIVTRIGPRVARETVGAGVVRSWPTVPLRSVVAA
ncbi:MAG TPA: alanine racemase [Pseudolysinimonas sp.]|nr:alanine racemase [Pseudolysinimonas sp.]